MSTDRPSARSFVRYAVMRRALFAGQARNANEGLREGDEIRHQVVDGRRDQCRTLVECRILSQHRVRHGDLRSVAGFSQ